MLPLPSGNINSGPSAERFDRQRMADEIARSAVFFRTGSDAGKLDPTTASAGAVPSATNAAAGAFNPMGAGPESTAAHPNDPTAIQNRQGQKDAFMEKGGDAATSNTGSLQAPALPYTVMAGMAAPAALVTGINSDLPGQIIAEVTQPIYDTATGHYLLIPPGSRLIGRYDSQVAFGQQWVLLVWLRLVLPDTSSIALDKLPGIRPAGYAGWADGVDWHWGRILAGAVLSTMLGVGSELAVSNQGNVNGNPSRLTIHLGGRPEIEKYAEAGRSKWVSTTQALDHRSQFSRRSSRLTETTPESEAIAILGNLNPRFGDLRAGNDCVRSRGTSLVPA